jgi:hypothetical protein
MDTTAELPNDLNNNPIQVGRPEPGSTKTVAAGASTAQSAVVGITGVYSVVSTVDAYIEIGTAPVATATTLFLAAGIPLFMRLDATDKIAGLQKTSAGVVHITLWR